MSPDSVESLDMSKTKESNTVQQKEQAQISVFRSIRTLF